MFTNIDVTMAASIIEEYYYVIAATTTVPLHTFMRCLEFYTTDAAFFTFLGTIYHQSKGLAMGNRLAQILAEIRTNYALLKALAEIDAYTMSFLYKYVDDVFTSVHSEHIDAVSQLIRSHVGMDITIESENKHSEVTFLDCTFKRNQDNTLSSRWYKKECCSMQVLNFHSYHPWHIKRNVVLNMIKNALSITSVEYLAYTKDMIERVLVNSSYPKLFIERAIAGNFNSAPQGVSGRSKTKLYRYVSCPYYLPAFDSMKATLTSNDIPVMLAPSPFSKNRNLIFSKLKDTRSADMKKNSIFNVRCCHCEFVYESCSSAVDVARTIENDMKNPSTTLAKHFLDFPTHKLHASPKIIKTFRSQYDALCSRNVAADIKKFCSK